MLNCFREPFDPNPFSCSQEIFAYLKIQLSPETESKLYPGYFLAFRPALSPGPDNIQLHQPIYRIRQRLILIGLKFEFYANISFLTKIIGDITKTFQFNMTTGGRKVATPKKVAAFVVDSLDSYDVSNLI